MQCEVYEQYVETGFQKTLVICSYFHCANFFQTSKIKIHFSRIRHSSLIQNAKFSIRLEWNWKPQRDLQKPIFIFIFKCMPTLKFQK